MGSVNFALQMAPYWAFGTLVLVTTYFSAYRELLTVQWPVVLRWLILVFGVTAIRYLMVSFTATPQDIENLMTTISWIPTWSTLCVPWEDLAHTVPLAVLALLLGEGIWSKIVRLVLLFVMMFTFGCGHLYQGPLAALFLSFYIPVTLALGKRYGFGTIMLCHVLYDLCTVSLIKYLI